MKNLRTTINNRFARMDRQWRRLPVKRQHHYMLLFFLAYALLTAAVVAGIWYEVRTEKKELSIQPITNPAIKKQKP